MPATFAWAQTWGAAAGHAVDLGTYGPLMNWKRHDDGTPGNYTTYPIQAGSNSYEVWLRLHFTGTFNKVQNIKFWKSAGSLGVGCTLLWASGGYQTYAQGTTATSSKATYAVPVAQPATANVSIAGSLGGSLVGAGYSDYILTQLKTTTAAAPGDTGTVSKVAPHSGDVMSGDCYMLETLSILSLLISRKAKSENAKVQTISREARPARVVAPQRPYAVYLLALGRIDKDMVRPYGDIVGALYKQSKHIHGAI